jgi:hypothetical protein
LTNVPFANAFANVPFATPVVSQESNDERKADQEPLGDLAQRAVSTLDGVDDTLSEILGIDGHGSPPDQDLLSNRAPTERSAL